MHLTIYLTAFAVLPASWGFLDNSLSTSKILKRVSQPASDLIPLGCLDFPASTAIALSFDSNSLTFESCQEFCVSAGHNYFGVTKGNTCVCMDSAFNALAKASKENCFTGCAGNLYEQSGNEGYIQAFSASTTSVIRSFASRDFPGALNSRGLFPRGATAKIAALGCWQFPVGSSLMSVRGNLDPANFRVEDCQIYCSSYSYFGVTTTNNGVADTCWCTSSLSLVGATFETSNFCAQPCTGNQFEMCGDDEYILIWGNPSPPTCNQTSLASVITVTITPTASTSTVFSTQSASTSTITNSATISITLPASTSTLVRSAIMTQIITLPGLTSTINTCSNTSSSTWWTTSVSKSTSSAISSTFNTSNTATNSITSTNTKSSSITTLLTSSSTYTYISTSRAASSPTPSSILNTLPSTSKTYIPTASLSNTASSLIQSSVPTTILATSPRSTVPMGNTNNTAPGTTQSSFTAIFTAPSPTATSLNGGMGQSAGQSGVPNTFNPSDGSRSQTTGQPSPTNTVTPSDGSNGQTAGQPSPTNIVSPSGSSNGQAGGQPSPTNTFTSIDGSNGQAIGQSGATNTFPSISPTNSPSNSSGIVSTTNTVCTAFATFYFNANLGGANWPQCGTPGTCYDVDTSWANQASSISWQDGVNCTLYHGTSCTGTALVVTPDLTATYGPNLWYPWLVFNDMLVSYTCY